MTAYAYAAEYSAKFQEQLLALPQRTLERVLACIRTLRNMPGLARDYDPQYEAAEAPVSCKCLVVPRTTKCLYLTVNEDEHVLRFFLLGDTRRDPRFVFTGVRGEV